MGSLASAGGHVDNLVVTAQQASPIPLNASFSCAPGELLALVGPSGSGKTTLLNMISGLSKPTTGSISISSQDIGKLKPGKDLANLVGMIDQQYSIIPELNVINNVLAGNLGNWSLFKSLLSNNVYVKLLLHLSLATLHISINSCQSSLAAIT